MGIKYTWAVSVQVQYYLMVYILRQYNVVGLLDQIDEGLDDR
jgi:hypothetical protein